MTQQYIRENGTGRRADEAILYPFVLLIFLFCMALLTCWSREPIVQRKKKREQHYIILIVLCMKRMGIHHHHHHHHHHRHQLVAFSLK